MFNTELIHHLQQLDHPVLYWFMVLISALGTIPAVLALVSAITYAVDFKKGLVLVNIVAWTAILTFVGKQQFNYPRPVDIDKTVNTIYYDKTELDLMDSQPEHFLESFSPELLEQTRNDEFDRYGFPSGHTSVQVCLWITLFFLFRKRWMIFVGGTFVILTIFSRLYLAHHFLGDVIGGFVIGLISSLLLILLVHKTAYLLKSSHQFKSLSILWLPILFVPFAPFIPLWLVGCLIGFNAAAILIIQVRNFPVFHVILWKRVLAAIICILLLLMAFFINKSYIVFENKFLELITISALYFVAIKGSIILCNRINLIRFRF